MAGSLILNVAYGIEVQSVHHPFMETIEKSMECLVEAGNPGSFLVDSIPSRECPIACIVTTIIK